MSRSCIKLAFLFFTGPELDPVGLEFSEGLNIVWGHQTQASRSHSKPLISCSTAAIYRVSTSGKGTMVFCLG